MPEEQAGRAGVPLAQQLELCAARAAVVDVLGGVVQRAVAHDDSVSGCRLARKRFEVCGRRVVELRARPLDAPPHVRVHALELEGAGRHQVVVSGDRDRAELGDARDAFVRARPVADEVAVAQKPLYAGAAERFEDRVEGV